MNTQDIAAVVTALSGICTAIFTGIVAYLAYRGIHQWQDSVKGQASFELARKMIVKAYDFQENYHRARRPIGSTADSGADATEQPSQSKIEERMRQRLERTEVGSNPYNRFDVLRQSYNDLHTSKIEAKYLLSDEVAHLVDPLEKTMNDLRMALLVQATNTGWEKRQRYLDRLPDNSPKKKMFNEVQGRYQDILNGTEDDDYAKTVDDSIDKLVAALEPFLRFQVTTDKP